MNRSRRRARSPPFSYADPRALGRPDPRAPPDYDDPAHVAAMTPYEPMLPNQMMSQGQHGPPPGAFPPGYIEHHPQYPPPGFRDNRLPSSYRATLRETYAPVPALAPPGSAPYKILCVTNINPKVADGPVRDALTADFSRFGDISVSICHDSGERLAYIYFRYYEEAREARHAKTRTLFFDRPLEIEPIYEPRSSPVNSPPLVPPPTHSIYQRRRSATPPEFYGARGPNQARRPPMPPSSPHNPQRDLTPPEYMQPPRYTAGSMQSPIPQVPPVYGRHPLPPRMQPLSPYSSPPHDASYRPQQGYPPAQYPGHLQHGHAYPPSYGSGPPGYERERVMIDEAHQQRSPRHDTYYPPDQRNYPPAAVHPSRSSMSQPVHYPHPGSPPAGMIYPQSIATPHRRSPPPPVHGPDYPRYASREYRRERYGREGFNEPDEGRPSRVLFITNLDASKSEADLRDIFNSFGIMEDVEVRKIGPDVASGLITFSSMDCAYKAKTALNGKHLGSLRCRIAYGKVSTSRRLWIGGLGPTTTTAILEQEFGRFGDIVSSDYTSGRPYAYIEYKSANQAQFATFHLKGTFAAQAERKLRIEYVDPVDRADRTSSRQNSGQPGSELLPKSRTTNESRLGIDYNASLHLNTHKRSATPSDIGTKRILIDSNASLTNSKRFEGGQEGDLDPSTPNASRSSVLTPQACSPTSEPAKPQSSDRNEFDRNESQKLGGSNDDNDISSEQPDHEVGEKGTSGDLDLLAKSASIRDLVDCCSTSWNGQLVLRNFTFPTRMHLFSGGIATIEKYITKLNGVNGSNCPVLRITQRWRLHPQPKLEEVKKRMQSGNSGMLIMTSRAETSPSQSPPNCKTPQSSSAAQGSSITINQANGNGDADGGHTTGESSLGVDEKSNPNQSRPLKNLISYLEQKDAAGVISLSALDGDTSEGSKLLYAFPPGDFALNLLKRKAPNLEQLLMKEEFLLGVIVGGEGKI